MSEHRRGRRAQIEVLWQKFKETKAVEERDAIIELYLPLVRYIARQLKERVPPQVPIDDLVSAGFLGLLEAVDSYDKKKGSKFDMFESYCVRKIRCAMLDELRRCDLIPHMTRVRINQVEQTISSLIGTLGRDPTEEEIANALGVSVTEYQKISQEVAKAKSFSKSSLDVEIGDDRLLADLLADKNSVEPLEKMIKEELFEFVTKSLSEEDAQILQLYYHDNFSFSDISKILNFTEARISQKHRIILRKLRERVRMIIRDL